MDERISSKHASNERICDLQKLEGGVARISSNAVSNKRLSRSCCSRFLKEINSWKRK